MSSLNSTKIMLGILTLTGVLGAAYLQQHRASEDTEDMPSISYQGRDNSGYITVGNRNINVINPASQPKACRDKAHGVERYNRIFEHEETSHWMGGGYSQDPWCNDVMGRLRGEQPEAEMTVIAKSEDKKSTCEPFNCPQYQYYCKVKVKTDPIYNERVSSACK